MQWWTLFPVAPYQMFFIAFYGQVVFAPFRFDQVDDSDRFLSLMEDYAAALRSALDRIEAQQGRGWLIPQPALPGVRATVAGLKSAAGETGADRSAGGAG